MARPRLSPRGNAVTVTVTLTPELYERLQLAAADRGAHRQSELVRTALHEYLGRIGFPQLPLPFAPSGTPGVAETTSGVPPATPGVAEATSGVPRQR